MKRTPPRLAAGLILPLALVLAAPAAARAVEVELLPIGSVAPEFSSEDPDGKPFTLAEARTRGPVMLVFWSLFCGTCMEELPIIQELLPRLQEKVQVVAVNLDEAPRARNVKQVAKQKGFAFTMLLNKLERKDAEGKVVEKKEFGIDQAYAVKATPALYLVNRDGTIAYGHYGALTPEELLEVVTKAK